MNDRKSLSMAKSTFRLDLPSLHLAELLRLFAKDSVSVRVAVLCGLLGAEIALRALMVLARLFLIAFFVCVSVYGQR
jgi:hypothetical protein